MRVLIFVLLAITLSDARRLVSVSQIEDLFKKALNNKLSEEDHQTLRDVIDILQRPELVSGRSLEDNSETRNTLECIICRSAGAALFESVHNGHTDDQLASTISLLCDILGLFSHSVCHGAVALNLPIINYILRNTPEATPAAFCGLVMQNANNPNICPFNDPRFEWQVDLPDPVALETVLNSTIEDPLTIVVLTDAHLDPLYEAFGVGDCDEPTCCRKGQSPRTSFSYKPIVNESLIEESIIKEGEDIKLDLDVAKKIRKIRSRTQSRYAPRNAEPAGYWGDYRSCDSPIWAYDDVIERITETHQNIDVIYYIGDTIDHGVWETTYELVNDMNRYVVDKIRDSFGDDVLVVPVIGNHESQPTNQFAPSRVTEKYLNTTWLYEALANKWDRYLTAEARETLLDRGDFSVLIRPGLRAISLNNNAAYKFNFWLVYDPLDAKRHLDWLIDELQKAELAGEKVHILTHIPPGVQDLTYTWTREYNRIVNRFSATIAAEFNGHTHSDEFKIFYNSDGTPINVAWGGGSATTYSNYNLNYKIATFDTDTFAPTNIVNFVYNLTEANLTPNRRPHWFQLYDMRNSFQIRDLSAASMGELVTRMLYFRFSATIAAEFNGHTHSDEFKIFYNSDGTPINVAWGGGIATTYSNYNLNYKIATFDTDTFVSQKYCLKLRINKPLNMSYVCMQGGMVSNIIFRES